MSSATPLPLERRRDILARDLADGTAKGWTVTAQTDTTATLTRKGEANGLVTILLLFLGILPGVLYYLLARPTETIFVRVDEFGEVFRTRGPT